MPVGEILCPPHSALAMAHREDFARCLQCEINRLREWLEGVRDFAERTMPHAMGQSHAAPMSLRSAAIKALAGEAEGVYRYLASNGGVK